MVFEKGGEWCEEDSKALDLEMLREELVAELQAINMYQEHVEMLDDGEAKDVIARHVSEEKEHVAALVKLILRLDPDQAQKFDKMGL
ncbi:MAG: rubrerythrin [Dehalococcoidia bacterium]|nr:rubrerythrin [Dehalococcoidia bacterium]